MEEPIERSMHDEDNNEHLDTAIIIHDHRPEKEENYEEIKSEEVIKIANNFVGFTLDDLKHFAQMSIPYTAATAIASAGNFISAFYLSQLGKKELTASGLITSTQLLVQGFLYSPLYAIGVYAGQAHGKKDRAALGKIFQQSTALACLLSVPLILVFKFSGEIWKLLGQDHEISDISQEFFDGYLLGCYGDILLTSTQQYGLAVEQQNAVFASSILQKALTLGLGYWWIHGGEGFPEQGVKGLGYAYSAGSVIATASLFLYLLLRRQIPLESITLSDIKGRLEHFWNLVKIGLPIGIHIGSETLSLSAMLAFAGWINENQLLASEIAMQYAGLCVVPIFGASQALGVLVAQAIGKGQPRIARQYANVGYIAGSVLPAVLTATLIGAADPLINLFVDSNSADRQSIISLSRDLMIVTATSLNIDYLRNAAIGASRGVHDTTVPMVINIFTCLINLALSYVLGNILELDSIGILSGRNVSILLAVMFLLPRWYLLISSVANKPALSPADERVPTKHPDQYASLKNFGMLQKFWPQEGREKKLKVNDEEERLLNDSQADDNTNRTKEKATCILF